MWMEGEIYKMSFNSWINLIESAVDASLWQNNHNLVELVEHFKINVKVSFYIVVEINQCMRNSHSFDP